VYGAGPGVEIETTSFADSGGREEEHLRSSAEDPPLDLTLQEKVERLAIVDRARTHTHEATKVHGSREESHTVRLRKPPPVQPWNRTLNTLGQRIHLRRVQAAI
jgi:hypothetical protein